MNLTELKSLVEIEKKKARLILCEAPQGPRYRVDAKWGGDQKLGGLFVGAEILNDGVLDAYNPPEHVFPGDPHQPRKIIVVKAYRADGTSEHIAFYSSSGTSYPKGHPKYVPAGKWISFGGIVYRGNNKYNHVRGINDPGYWVVKAPGRRKDVNKYSNLAKWLDNITANGAFGRAKRRLRNDQVNAVLNKRRALRPAWRDFLAPNTVFQGVEVSKDYYHVKPDETRSTPFLDPKNIPPGDQMPAPEKLSNEARERGYASNPVYDKPKQKLAPETKPEGRRQDLRNNFRNAVNRINNRRGYVVLPRTLTKGWKPVSKKSGADATIIGQRLQEMAPEMPATNTKRILDFWGTKAGTVGAVIDLGLFASEIHEIIDNKNLSQNQKEKLIRDKAKKNAIDASKDTAICFVLAKTLTPAACAAYLFGPLVYYAGAAALTIAKGALGGLGDFLSDLMTIGLGTNTPEQTAEFERDDQVLDSSNLPPYEEEPDHGPTDDSGI